MSSVPGSDWVRSWELWKLRQPAVWFLLAIYLFTATIGVVMWVTSGLSLDRSEIGLALVCVIGSVLSLAFEYRLSSDIEESVHSGAEDAWLTAAAIGIPSLAGMLTVFPVIIVEKLLGEWGRRRTGQTRLVTTPHKLMFNGCQYACQVALGHAVFVALTWNAPAGASIRSVGSAAAAVFAAVTVQAVNAILIAGILRCATGPGVNFRALLQQQAPGAADGFPVKLLGILIVCGWDSAPLTIMLAVPLLSVMQQAVMHRALLARTRQDAKTGLANAEFWRQTAEATVDRSRAGGPATSVLIIDLDFFKKVNDTYGHLAGDDVLKEVAARLKATVRPQDLVGRFGGEEFVVLLPGSDEVESIAVAERCRAAVAAAPVLSDTAKASIPVTCSVGVASVSCGGKVALAGLMDASDRALYRAKESGRNRVEHEDVTGTARS